MSTDALISVVLVDDQELIRSGLRRILRRRDGFDIAAECTDGDEVLATIASMTPRPDVIINGPAHAAHERHTRHRSRPRNWRTTRQTACEGATYQAM